MRDTQHLLSARERLQLLAPPPPPPARRCRYRSRQTPASAAAESSSFCPRPERPPPPSPSGPASPATSRRPTQSHPAASAARLRSSQSDTPPCPTRAPSSSTAASPATTLTSNRVLIARSLICATASFSSRFAASFRAAVSLRRRRRDTPQHPSPAWPSAPPADASRFSTSASLREASAPNAITSASVCAILPLQPVQRRQPIFDLLQPSRRSVDVLGKLPHLGVHILHRRLRRRQLLRRSRKPRDRTAPAPPRASAPHPASSPPTFSLSYSSSCALIAAVYSRSEFASTRFSASSCASSSSAVSPA